LDSSSLSAPESAFVGCEDVDVELEVSAEVVLAAAVDELEVDCDFELEDELEDELDLELDLELELEVERVEVDDMVVGSNFTPVNTTCNKRSDACPLNVVSTVVAWSDFPHPY
jgi:hypothetical protein